MPIGVDVDFVYGILKEDLVNRLVDLETHLIDKYLLVQNDIYFQKYKSVFMNCNPINSIV